MQNEMMVVNRLERFGVFLGDKVGRVGKRNRLVPAMEPSLHNQPDRVDNDDWRYLDRLDRDLVVECDCEKPTHTVGLDAKTALWALEEAERAGVKAIYLQRWVTSDVA